MRIALGGAVATLIRGRTFEPRAGLVKQAILPSLPCYKAQRR